MRSAEGLFLVDGPVLLAEALDSPLALRAVYVEEDAKRGTSDQVVAAATDAGVSVRQVRTGVLAKVLEGKCWSQPVLANGRIYVRNAPGKVVCLDVSAK